MRYLPFLLLALTGCIPSPDLAFTITEAAPTESPVNTPSVRIPNIVKPMADCPCNCSHVACANGCPCRFAGECGMVKGYRVSGCESGSCTRQETLSLPSRPDVVCVNGAGGWQWENTNLRTAAGAKSATVVQGGAAGPVRRVFGRARGVFRGCRSCG